MALIRSYTLSTKDMNHWSGKANYAIKMGDKCRIRHYSTNHGFWDTKSARKDKKATTTRKNKQKTYAQRTSKYCDSVNLFEIVEFLYKDTGEIIHKKNMDRPDLGYSVSVVLL
jgi:Ni,Fe-hydrogenase I small subunit